METKKKKKNQFTPQSMSNSNAIKIIMITCFAKGAELELFELASSMQ